MLRLYLNFSCHHQTDTPWNYKHSFPGITKIQKLWEGKAALYMVGLFCKTNPVIAPERSKFFSVVDR